MRSRDFGKQLVAYIFADEEGVETQPLHADQSVTLGTPQLDEGGERCAAAGVTLTSNR
jgi:hypothetical protein